MSGQIHVPPALVRFVRNATRASIGAAAEHIAQIALMPEGPRTEANLLAAVAATESPVALYRELDPAVVRDDIVLLDLAKYPFVVAALEEQYVLELSRLQELPADRFAQPALEREELSRFVRIVKRAAGLVDSEDY